MSKKEANERLIPIARQRGDEDYRGGYHKSQNPYRKGELEPDLVRAYEAGWDAARKQHLKNRGSEDGDTEDR